MATVSFPIPSQSIPAGTTQFAFADITSQVPGHTYYSIGVDTSAYTAQDMITVLTRFRVNGTTIVDGCAAGPTPGGPHNTKQGQPGGLVGCASNIPPFTSKLEATVVTTVPRAGTLSGRIDLI